MNRPLICGIITNQIVHFLHFVGDSELLLFYLFNGFLSLLLLLIIWLFEIKKLFIKILIVLVFIVNLGIPLVVYNLHKEGHLFTYYEYCHKVRKKNKDAYLKADEISVNNFFDLRMQNKWAGKFQGGWFIKENNKDKGYVYIAYAETERFPEDLTIYSEYKKCNRSDLEKELPTYRTSDGIELGHIILSKIKYIQDEDIKEKLDLKGVAGCSNNFSWIAQLEESNITVDVDWRYSVDGKPYNYKFIFTIDVFDLNDVKYETIEENI